MADSPVVDPQKSPRQAGAASGDEAKRFHDIVRTVPLPKDVQRVEFRFGEDSTGEPAVWIVLITKDDLKPSKAKIADLQRAAEEMRSMVHSSESNRWPYVEIATE